MKAIIQAGLSATYGLSALKDIVEAILAIQSVFP